MNKEIKKEMIITQSHILGSIHPDSEKTEIVTRIRIPRLDIDVVQSSYIDSEEKETIDVSMSIIAEHVIQMVIDERVNI